MSFFDRFHISRAGVEAISISWYELFAFSVKTRRHQREDFQTGAATMNKSIYHHEKSFMYIGLSSKGNIFFCCLMVNGVRRIIDWYFGGSKED